MRKNQLNMRKAVIMIICALAMCSMAFAMMSETANAASRAKTIYTHTIYYNFNGGTTFWAVSPIKVKDNKYFTIDGQQPFKEHYRFNGYNAYRMKDAKWYVAGKGWVKSQNGAKRYQPGQKLKMDSSWTKGCKNSNFKLYAQWTHIHYVRFLKSNGSSFHVNEVADNESFTINKKLSKKGYYFIGWNLKRIDKSGTKWYVAGKGWCTQNEINYYGYKKKLYEYGKSYKLDSSWTKGSSGWADYALTPVYQESQLD